VSDLTVVALSEAVRAGDLVRVRTMLAARPELANLDTAASDERRALHHAVLSRSPEMVRVLMAHGADAHKGVWPHRDATSALTLALDRGLDEIVHVIREEERRRETVRRAPAAPAEAPAAKAPMRAATAVAAGDVAWVRAAHARGERWTSGDGLVALAVEHNRPDLLGVLLDLGLDPDQRLSLDYVDEAVDSWGEPLWHCVRQKRHAMAERLLVAGADPNGKVYAAGSALFEAYAAGDQAMIALLQRFGARIDAGVAGSFGMLDRARELLAEDGASAVAADLLFSGTDAGDPDMVQLALRHLDWPRDDARWHWYLLRPLGAHAEPDRPRYAACFRQIVERAGANAPGRYGRTILHDMAAAWPHTPVTPPERVSLATILLEAGARTDIRDELLGSTALGWACRWGRLELVTVLLASGADPREEQAEPWATPLAWAERSRHPEVAAALRRAGAAR